MSETIQFWLDNKMSAGIKVAELNGQALVAYREKFYVIERDAAQMKGGKPLHYSKSSLPAIWKKAIRGEAPAPETIMPPSEETLPVATITRGERVKKQGTGAPSLHQPAIRVPAPAQSTPLPQPAAKAKPDGSTPKMEKKRIAQVTVTANCPYCSHKHELPLEKGKNGRPFFVPCTRCKTEFAVRFVPVTMYQAQVAGFR